MSCYKDTKTATREQKLSKNFKLKKDEKGKS